MKQEKTVKEWLQWSKGMGCDWANEAIESLEESSKDQVWSSLSEALLVAFNWEKHPRGIEYWNAVQDTAYMFEIALGQHQPAAQTLQTSPDRATIAATLLAGLFANNARKGPTAVYAEAAVFAADALIAELEKPVKVKDDPF